MKTKDERAAAMRDVYLGFTASADLTWDELPQRHRDRWLATLDAAMPDVPPQPIRCIFCDHESATLADLREHSAKCEAHPLWPKSVDRDAWKTDLFLPDDTEQEGYAFHAEYDGGMAFVWCEAGGIGKGAHLTPERAARSAAWLSSYAAAHGCAVGLADSTPVIADLHRQLSDARREVDEYLRMYENEQKNADHWKAKAALADAAVSALRDQLDAAEIELADKAFYVREFAAVSAERDGLKKRNDVQAEQLIRIDSEISPLMSEVAELKAERDAARAELAACMERAEQAEAERDAIRERAAVPVPAGVPSVRDLREIGVHAYLSHDSAKRENAGCMVGPMGAAADAIRDAVLRGAEQPSSNAGQFDDDEVEALARVLRAAPDKWWPALDETWDRVKDMYLDQARAAIAHLRKRPEGLPTAEELKQVYRDGWNEGAGGDTCASGITAILAALAPWLREPVGWELDVTVEELAPIYWAGRSTQFGIRDFNDLHEDDRVLVLSGLSAVLDLCRSSIRPVYECKECANWKAHAAAIEDSSFDMIKRINLARAALEGE